MERQARWRGRDTLAVVTLAATSAILAWLPVAPWMIRLWIGVAVVLALVVTAVLLLGAMDETESRPWPARLHRVFPGVTATVCFAIIAVLAANLDTPRYAGDPWVFSVLGADMVLVVALYLSSYDRGTQKAPWK